MPLYLRHCFDDGIAIAEQLGFDLQPNARSLGRNDMSLVRNRNIIHEVGELMIPVDMMLFYGKPRFVADAACMPVGRHQAVFQFAGNCPAVFQHRSVPVRRAEAESCVM